MPWSPVVAMRAEIRSKLLRFGRSAVGGGPIANRGTQPWPHPATARMTSGSPSKCNPQGRHLKASSFALAKPQTPSTPSRSTAPALPSRRSPRLRPRMQRAPRNARGASSITSRTGPPTAAPRRTRGAPRRCPPRPAPRPPARAPSGSCRAPQGRSPRRTPPAKRQPAPQTT